jgi:hypothetical protein
MHTVPTDMPSVAVRPFVNMSRDPANGYFSDGLSEEILDAQSRIPRLYVPARTASFRFNGKTGASAVSRRCRVWRPSSKAAFARPVGASGSQRSIAEAPRGTDH